LTNDKKGGKNYGNGIKEQKAKRTMVSEIFPSNPDQLPKIPITLEGISSRFIRESLEGEKEIS